MGNWCESTGTSEEKLGDLGGSKDGANCDGHEKKVGKIQAHENNRWNRKHPSSCQIEDREEAP